MEHQEAAAIINALAQCLRNDPNQFYQVSVSLTGTRIQASAPGATGMRVTATGGRGGNVVGAEFRQQVGDIEIDFAHRQADEHIRQQIDAAADILSAISAELKERAPDRKKLGDRVRRLASLAMPSIVIEIVRVILTRSVGVEF